VARDRETGVGQIMATTPMSRPFYMLGKWISNFAVLMTMVVILVLFGLAIQLINGESTQVDVGTYLSPFVFIVMPVMAVVAAVAVLFEAIPFLSGGFGNILYFFAFVTMIPFTMESEIINTNPALEPLGIALLKEDMSQEVLHVFPDYDGSFMLGGMETPITGTFAWTGIDWTSSVMATRFGFIGLAILVTLLGALLFDRFDPSRTKPRKTKTIVSPSRPEAVSTIQAAPAIRLTPFHFDAHRFRFFTVLTAELKLLLKAQPWWWYIAAAGAIVACLVSPAETTRQFILPYAWVWPVLIWSSMGSRETRHNVQQFTFASASPLWRQLPAQWIAGFIVTLVMGSGAALRFASSGDSVGLIAFCSSALFIPSLALALGVWGNSSKPFEILYVTLWYLGPLNKVPGLDFIGANSAGYPAFYLPLSIALIAFAFLGRVRQLRN
jgi:hypothetical protein